MPSWFWQCAKVCSAVGAIAGTLFLWSQFGLPYPALSDDIKRLDAADLEIKEELYSKQLEDLTILNLQLQNTPNISARERATVEGRMRRLESELDTIRRKQEGLRHD